MSSSEPAAPARTRRPIERVGATVLREFVQAIVTGEYGSGQILPTEGELTAEFGVSRTVIRETMKRLQEKGMITVAQGRGTHVLPITSWNVLDPLVLSTMISNDRTLGVLDDLSIVRSALEAEMAGDAAAVVDDGARTVLRERIEEMTSSVADSRGFRDADVQFHLAVMDLSSNALAANIARALILHAVHSDRYTGLDPTHAFELTLAEHQAVVDAIDAGDERRAREAMRDHILGSWQRRRLPTERSSSP
ncbi:FadR/GntR family transcriptional regulator [Ruania alba]|uniref:DNA-binding transcriptional regulator, FadR family n=1 Tax=Ruania alba TaxID=648782 RepID=A0A1H5KU02_9MICO|nr:FadR/GntR family transcriptional regulator [Ruania alba]SEE67438.1 DNA-binding transcriptional regulator, FadR family [Ruania alba]